MNILKTVFLLSFFFLFTSLSAQSIDSLFARVPRKVMPLLERNSKLDLLDLYNNRLTAKAENTYGGQVEMTQKTDCFINLRTSDVGRWQMRLLPADRDTLLLCVHSLKAGGVSSHLAVYHSDWGPAKMEVPAPLFERFFEPDSTLSYVRVQALAVTLRQLPIEAMLTDSLPTITFRISTEGLSLEDRKDAEKCLHPIHYLWSAGKFALLPRQRH